MTLQTLSASIAAPAEWDDQNHAVNYVITLKDGRKIFDELMAQYTAGDEMLQRIHALPGCETDTIEQYVPLAENYWEKDSATDVFCYSEPIDRQRWRRSQRIALLLQVRFRRHQRTERL